MSPSLSWAATVTTVEVVAERGQWPGISVPGSLVSVAFGTPHPPSLFIMSWHFRAASEGQWQVFGGTSSLVTTFPLARTAAAAATVPSVAVRGS